MTGPRIGSLFSGYGGLDMGVMATIGGEVAWHVEYDKAPSKILAHHWPDIPNFGDVTTTDWSSVPPVDVLTGGFPCQDVSLAGRRAGLTNGTRSGLWSEYARAIDVLKPKMVVIENVRGLLSAQASGALEPDPWGMGDGATRPVVNALGVVLGDLASLGYDTRWCGLRAADAGAPHARFRVFVIAYPRDAANVIRERGRRLGEQPEGDAGSPRGAGRRAPQDADGATRGERGIAAPGQAEAGRARSDAGRRGGAPVTDSNDQGRELIGRVEPKQRDADRRNGADPVWGAYEPAIRRWEAVSGRVAPAATNTDGKAGNARLSAAFVEWMMGLPVGHVTQAGLSRAEQLKALGNGVVPQQAELALRTLLAA